jgi:hypothetical protein
MSAPNLANWKPSDLLSSARNQPLDAFVTQCDAPYLLLIKLDDPNSELALGLEADEPREQGRDGLAFRTVQRNISSVMESLEAARRAKDHTLTVRSTAVAATGRPQPPVAAAPMMPGAPRPGQLSPEVVRGMYHVLPLRKRSEAAFLRSVSVGRARNHDIVLRHRSVSKFHGSIDIDDEGRLFVRDANSSNHTFVNGRQVSERAELHPGDTLQFGSVEAHLCTTESLWRTLRGL